jgi:hypothetical protein
MYILKGLVRSAGNQLSSSARQAIQTHTNQEELDRRNRMQNKINKKVKKITLGRGFFFGEETVYPKVSPKVCYFLRLKNWYDVVCKSHNSRVLYIETEAFCNVIRHNIQM